MHLAILGFRFSPDAGARSRRGRPRVAPSFAAAALAFALAASSIPARARCAQDRGELPPAAQALQAGPCALALDPASGSLARLDDPLGKKAISWFEGPARLEVLRESDGAQSSPELVSLAAEKDATGATSGIRCVRRLPGLGLELRERWSAGAADFEWRLLFAGEVARSGHEIRLELPVLARDRSLFTPSERGEMALEAYPAYEPAPYGHVGWNDGRYYVLPLAAVFDRSAGRGLTIALSPERPIPHLQVSWEGARSLKFRLAHRALGSGESEELRILFNLHEDDYRCVLAAYAGIFPRFFRPALPRSAYEGAFYYHHIQDRPSFEEMARQGVRFLWASFWFPYLGEYLPEAAEWHPYTYARWWKLGETMTDEKIRAFARELWARGIGTFAYFNVTEYGGAGGSSGDAAEAEKILKEKLGDALVRKEDGQPIATWEGAFAVNPRPEGPLFPILKAQVERHLRRLPEIAGFVIDRLDWASAYDYGRSDGLTMVGSRAVECLAGPVAAAVAEVCRLAQASGKRVFVNQFWRVELLRDVDGYCHEYDYPRGLGYLSPYRPAAAWNHEKPYSGDLLAFEAQLKTRLLFAVFPQMIARDFPISQQAPDPEAAELLEVYAPLFEPLRAKDQVLLARPIEVDGPNEANLFVQPALGTYAAPVISRVGFLSRVSGRAQPATLRIRVPEAGALSWAHVLSAEGPPARGEVRSRDGCAEVVLPEHRTAAVVVLGGGTEPELYSRLEESAAKARAALAGKLGAREADAAKPSGEPPAEKAGTAGDAGFFLSIRGEHVGTRGVVEVALGENALGKLEGASGRFALPAERLRSEALWVELRTFDDGTWFVPERAEIEEVLPGGGVRSAASWRAGETVRGSGPRRIVLPLARR